MKKQIFKYATLIIFSGLILAGCENKKKDTVNQEELKTVTEKTHSWTENDKLIFQKNSNGFLTAHSVENPEKYTNCLLKTVIDKYPNPDDALEIGQNELTKLFEESDCLDGLLLVKIVSPWNKETEQIFLDNCVSSAKKNAMTAEQAKTYCDCALIKVKEIIPNPQHLITLTEEEYNSILKDCK